MTPDLILAVLASSAKVLGRVCVESGRKLEVGVDSPRPGELKSFAESGGLLRLVVLEKCGAWSVVFVGVPVGAF